MKTTTDIDIDFKDRLSALRCVDNIPAMMVKDSNQVKHPSGVYFTEIPINPITGLPSFNYKEAEEKGYIKLDFLNNTLYSNVRDREHLKSLVDTEVIWELLLEDVVIEQLAHIRGHADVVRTIKPKSIEDLAIVLALIRPAKRYLLNESIDVIKEKVWVKPNDDEYYFKKSHATAYALSIVVQLNLLVEETLS